jgi:hypothetical protein
MRICVTDATNNWKTGLMDIAILDFKPFEERAPVGFFNFAVCGVATTGFKA